MSCLREAKSVLIVKKHPKIDFIALYFVVCAFVSFLSPALTPISSVFLKQKPLILKSALEFFFFAFYSLFLPASLSTYIEIPKLQI